MTPSDAQECWRTILRLLERTSDPEVLSALAAGPLQLLIEHAGTAYVDQIECAAWSSPAFRQLLTFIWDCAADDVWARVDAIRSVARTRAKAHGASVY